MNPAIQWLEKNLDMSTSVAVSRASGHLPDLLYIAAFGFFTSDDRTGPMFSVKLDVEDSCDWALYTETDGPACPSCLDFARSWNCAKHKEGSRERPSHPVA